MFIPVEPDKALEVIVPELSGEQKEAVVTFGKTLLQTSELKKQVSSLESKLNIIEAILDEGTVVHWCVMHVSGSDVLKYVSGNLERVTGFAEFNPKTWEKDAVVKDDRGKYREYCSGSTRNLLANAIFEYNIENSEGKNVRIRERRRAIKDGTGIRIYGTFEHALF